MWLWFFSKNAKKPNINNIVTIEVGLRNCETMLNGPRSHKFLSTVFKKEGFYPQRWGETTHNRQGH